MSRGAGTARYSARIGDSVTIADEVSYETLLARIVEFTLRAAVERAADRSAWEHDEFRRLGLGALQIVRDGRAIWTSAANYERELKEARREGIEATFTSRNALDLALSDQLDGDLVALWRRAGYAVPSLATCMKKLFNELEADEADRATEASERFVQEVLDGIFSRSS